MASATRAVARFGGRAGRPLASVQVKQNDLVPEVGVAGDGAAAAIFGIAGMAAGDNHLELTRRVLGLVRSRWVRCRRQRQSDRAGAAQKTGLAQKCPS